MREINDTITQLMHCKANFVYVQWFACSHCIALNKAHIECTLLLGVLPVKIQVYVFEYIYSIRQNFMEQLRHHHNNIPCLEYDTVWHMTVTYIIAQLNINVLLWLECSSKYGKDNKV